MWTPQKVRDELPNVPVFWNGKSQMARVSGRKERFACVWLERSGISWEVSWDTVANVLNNGRAIIIG